MKLNELNPDQLNELKVNYYAAKLDERGEGMSFGEMCEIDNLVSMDELEAEYGATEFVNDDFCCSFQEITPEPDHDHAEKLFSVICWLFKTKKARINRVKHLFETNDLTQEEYTYLIDNFDILVEPINEKQKEYKEWYAQMLKEQDEQMKANEPEPTAIPTDRVVFRKFEDGEVIALFPDMIEDMIQHTCNSYMHIGQHGAASIDLLDELEEAEPIEYAELAQELRGIGYNIEIVKRPSKKSTDRIMDNRHKKAIEYFNDFCQEYEDCFAIKDALRSIHSGNEIDDSDYEYILMNWDRLLNNAIQKAA